MNEFQAKYVNPIFATGAGVLGSDIRPTSLEERLEHLHRAVERICGLRGSLENLLGRLHSGPPPADCGKSSPTPQDLNSKFGESINALHDNLDRLDSITARIGNALFSAQPAQCEKGR